MLTRKPIFPNVIELNMQAGKLLGCNVYLVFDQNDWILIDIGFEETVDEIVELIRQMDFPLSNCKTLIATHADADQMDYAVLQSLQDADVDWVLLLGYMKKLGKQTLQAYQGRILNTHPALLPKFGGQGYFGRKVHEAVLAAGEQQSGATVHLVDGEYDTGPLMAQVRVPVKSNDTVDTLEARVKTAEQKLLIHTLIEMAQQPRAVNS